MNNMLEVAVKLAGLGAAGVGVFAIISCLWILGHPAKYPGSQQLIKWFMGLCALMAVVTAVSSYMGGLG